MPRTSQAGLLHERVADHVAALIDRGALRAGQRVPSVRRLSAQMHVSTATVVLGYSRLEARGLLEARPQSGHYVRSPPRAALAEPRTARAQPGATRVKLGDRVTGLYRSLRDRDIVPFGAACPSPDLLPLDRLGRSVALAARTAGHAGALYDALPGNARLRAHIARRAVQNGAAVRADDVIVTWGAIEAIQLCLRAVAAPGDAVIVERPTYFGGLRLLEEMGLQAVEVPAHPTTGMDLDALEAALRRHRVKACLAVPSFSNPLGALMPDDAKRALVDTLARRRVPLIETDVYGDLPHDGRRPRPAKAFDRDGWVMYCSSFSKTLAPGYRVGWAIPGRFHERVDELKFTYSGATPTITQMAIADFLDAGGYDRHLRQLRRHVAAQVAAVRDAVARHFPTGTRTSRPLGGLLLWVALPRGAAHAVDLQRRALARGISIAPGPIFAARDGFQNCLRLNCGYPWSDALERAIETLASLAR
jgi:DNA-binding transcriptional MocR family regulator